MLRKLKPRPHVYPANDPYFLDAESLRKILGYSRWYFYRRILPNSFAYGIPPAVLLGPTDDLEFVRWRCNDLYTLRRDLDPYRDPTTGVTTTWMERFRQRQRA